MKKVTIHDVCRDAGVSISTVSNVLNDKPNVGEATRKRVWSAIERLKFTPSASARNLSRRRTDTIAVMLPFFAGYFGRHFQGVQEVTAPAGYYLLTVVVQEMAEMFKAVMKLIQEQRVDGLILYNQDFSNAQVRELLKHKMPIVAPDRHTSGPHLPTVFFDNFKAGYEATRHMIDHGYERIATLTGPLKWVSASERLRGYRAAMRDYGLKADASLVVEGSWIDEPSTAHFIAHFRNRAWPQAIVAGNDWMALGLLRYARNHRDAKVRSTAIIGFDDVDYANTAGLTTMGAPWEELGRRSARFLLELIREGPEAKRVIPSEPVPVQLIVRSSCGCAASSV
ncbi:MAG: LacI family DNA-binding transcriptional regulator [Verrucomicrobiae bacterium]|nr:LacI family DNA-binding transcriptional regulator [Verrucomicrobiae bacterium]